MRGGIFADVDMTGVLNERYGITVDVEPAPPAAVDAARVAVSMLVGAIDTHTGKALLLRTGKRTLRVAVTYTERLTDAQVPRDEAFDVVLVCWAAKDPRAGRIEIIGFYGTKDVAGRDVIPWGQIRPIRQFLRYVRPYRRAIERKGQYCARCHGTRYWFKWERGDVGWKCAHCTPDVYASREEL